MLELPYSKEYKVFNIHQLYFKFQKMNREKWYKEEEVEKIYQTVKQLLENKILYEGENDENNPYSQNWQK